MAKSPSFSRIAAAFVVLSIWGLSSCLSSADAEPQRAPTRSGSLQPYLSPTPSKTPFPVTPAPTQSPLPSPTPHLYTIAKGDTMSGIALRFGISAETLLAANPSVPPSAMSVGTELRIPDGEISFVEPTVEPLPLELAEPNCYPSGGGVWCFLSLYNGTEENAESVSAAFHVHDSKTGRLLAEKQAFLPLDQLPAAESGVLSVFFPNFSADDVNVYALLQTALPSPMDEKRYLSVSLQNVLTEIAWDGMSAQVSGKAAVVGDFSRLWVAVSAYDVDGKVVGVRRWESVAGERAFSLTVASLGHAIDTVLISAEAKP